MQRRALLLLLFGFCWAGPVPVPVPQVFEFDSEDSRRVLGSSVVTSVSVIMDLGNGTKAFFADAAGRPMPRPPALSPVGSPVELLSPDRYEFYTFDEFGDLVRRYMTLDQIQSIIASGDGEVRPLPGQLEDYRPSSGTADVGDVIASVQNVLRGAMNTSEKPTTRRPPPPRPTKRPEVVHKTTTIPSDTPPVLKPARPLPPLQTVTTQPLPTVSVETPRPPVVQLTTDNISSTMLPSTKPSPINSPANATTVSEITSTSTQSNADTLKTESTGQQSTTVLPTSPVTLISVEITSSEANETGNANVSFTSNTSVNESVDSESVQSEVTTENSVQTEQLSSIDDVMNDTSSTTETSTSVSNGTSYSSNETTTVSSAQIVYNESSTEKSNSLQNETINNDSALAEPSTSNQQESQTSSSVENAIDSQSAEETSLDASTELSSMAKRNETTNSEISETTEYITEIVSVQTGESSLNVSVQNGTDNLESENNSISSAMEEITSFESNSNAVSNTTNNITGTVDTGVAYNQSGANTTEGEDSSIIMEEMFDSTLASTNQESAEASTTTAQPENFTSSTANVSIIQFSAQTSSETYSTEISILTQPTESSNKVFTESNSEGSSGVYKVPSTSEDDIIRTTQTYSDITFSENVSSSTKRPLPPRPTKRPQDMLKITTIPSETEPSSTRRPPPPPPTKRPEDVHKISTIPSESESASTRRPPPPRPTKRPEGVIKPPKPLPPLETATTAPLTPLFAMESSTGDIQKLDDNDTRNDVTTTTPMDSYLPQELIDSLSSVMSQFSEDDDQQNLADLKFSSENDTATTVIPEMIETTTILSFIEKLAVNSSSLEIDVIGETSTVNIDTELTSVSANNDIQETETSTKEEEVQMDTTTQESSLNNVGGTATFITTTLSINSDESDSIQATTVIPESSYESLNISFKSGNANTSTEESTLPVSEHDFEQTTSLATDAEDQSNIITTMSPLDSISESDTKIFTTESSSGDIQTTTVPSKSSDYTTVIVNDEKNSETEAPPEQTTSLSMDLPQTTEIDSILKLITKGETRISLIEEPSSTTNETQSLLSAVYNNETSYEPTENVGSTEPETTTFTTQPSLQEADISNNTSETFSPESKEDSATTESVAGQDETNTTAIYSTSTAQPGNDTLEAEIETTYVSGTKDENVVSEYDASVKESSQTVNGTDNESSSTFLKNAYNETDTGTEVNTTNSFESSTSSQFDKMKNGSQSTAEEVSAVYNNDTSPANVDTDYSNSSNPVQTTQVTAENVTTTESPTEQPALKADLQNGYETSSDSSGVLQNSSSIPNVNESDGTVDITTTVASQIDSSTETTKTGDRVQETGETSSKESEVSSSDGSSTEGSTSASASPISLTAPEIEDPGDNALKDGVDTPAPVDLRPSQNEHLGLEATTASLERGVRRFADLCNELALRLWAAVAARGATSARSLVMSPFAVTSLLAMVFLGARGPTSAEMNDLLRLDDMVTFNPHLIFRNITETLVHGRTPGIASVAFVRQLYSDKNKGKLLDFYKDRAQQFYDGHVEEANFRVIGDLVRRRTNLLVKRQTRGRVPEFLRGPGVALRPPLAAFSANVLQTDCSDAGMEGRDGEMYFTVTPSPRERRLIPVPAAVWRQGVYAGYDPQIDATVAALGVDSAVSLIFVSPGQQGNVAPGDGLPQLERRLLTPAAWSRLLRSLLPRPGLELQVPRFSHRSLLNATGALQRLGLRDLLTPGRADLRGLDGLGDLHLADVLAATALTTCAGERGHAEAYPARAARLLDSDADADASDLPLALRPRQARRPPPPARLRYDKPFFYAVRHNPTGVILHMGRFNPRLQ